MVRVEIAPQEIEALDKLFKEAKCLVIDGFILGSFRVRVQRALLAEAENKKKVVEQKDEPPEVEPISNVVARKVKV